MDSLSLPVCGWRIRSVSCSTRSAIDSRERDFKDVSAQG